MAKKAAKDRGLVLGYLERISSAAFEKYSGVITELVGGKNGIYALYRRKMTQHAMDEIGEMFGKGRSTSTKRKAAQKAASRKPASAKGGRPGKSPLGVTLKGLLKNKRLRGTYKGKEYLARVLKSGRVRLKHTGQIFDSPSGAAKAVRGSETNGWTFWRFRDEQGEWV